jgi:hypothetical protein
MKTPMQIKPKTFSPMSAETSAIIREFLDEVKIEYDIEEFTLAKNVSWETFPLIQILRKFKSEEAIYRFEKKYAQLFSLGRQPWKECHKTRLVSGGKRVENKNRTNHKNRMNVGFDEDGKCYIDDVSVSEKIFQFIILSQKEKEIGD